MSFQRGSQPDDRLKLSHDRKVSPKSWLQNGYTSDKGIVRPPRYVPVVPNSFGLPSGLSCPGKTAFCESCYASNTENYSPGVRDLVTHNYELLLKAGTVQGMAELLCEMIETFLEVCDKQNIVEKNKLFRIHWDGDFFSEDYALAWAVTMRHFPDVPFWTYTRSFVEPVNVVPILAQVPNLALYLSVDTYNADAGRQVAADHPGIMLALCGEDYATAREIAPERKPMICPENSGRIPLVSERAVGACVECRLCPEAKRDIIFSTSHQENVQLSFPVEIIAGRCRNPDCRKILSRKPGSGRTPIYCSDPCRWKMYRLRQKARANV